MYIDSLSGYVKDCDESFVKFPTTYEEMNKRVSDAKKHFSDHLQEAKKEANDAAEKHERAIVERTSGEAFTTILSMASRGGATAGAMGIISPDVAVLGSLFNLFQTYLARTNEGTAVLDVMKQERAQEEMATKKKILEDAVRRVVDLRESVLNAESLVKDMKSHLDRASKVLQQKRGLTDSNDEQNIDFHDLKNKLDKLKRAAGEIVTAIGEDGSTPISSNIDKLNS